MARGAHGNEDGRTIDDGRKYEGRERRIIDHVHRYAALLRRLRYRGVDCDVVRCGDHCDRIAEARRRERRGDVAQLPARCHGGELRVQQRGDDRHPRTGLQKRAHLAQGNDSPADNHDRLLLQAQEDGQIVHAAPRAAHAGAGSAAAEAAATGTGAEGNIGCRPHSRDSARSHHQRPARRLSPG